MIGYEAGSPAGAARRAVEAFADTAGHDGGPDALGSREQATAWLQAAGWLPAEAALSNSEHNALIRLRNGVRDPLSAPAGSPAAADAAARLTRALAEGRPGGPGGAGGLAAAARASYPSVVAAVAAAIAHAAYSGVWPPGPE